MMTQTLGVNFSDVDEPVFIGVSERDFNELSASDQERFTERAGIYEFDGGLSRESAEKMAAALFPSLAVKVICEAVLIGTSKKSQSIDLNDWETYDM